MNFQNRLTPVAFADVGGRFGLSAYAVSYTTLYGIRSDRTTPCRQKEGVHVIIHVRKMSARMRARAMRAGTTCTCAKRPAHAIRIYAHCVLALTKSQMASPMCARVIRAHDVRTYCAHV
eukprot:2707923-Pleurochrysis_carterae.AAC.3